MNKKQMAIVQLCYADFESLELSLAALTKFTDPGVHIFLLQNGRGTYDTERTYRVCLRYKELFPNQITVVDWIKPQKPYFSIRELLHDKCMEKYTHILKIDDDVFPLTNTWVEDLIDCYNASYKKYGNKLGYVTSLVNNNPWGFVETLKIMNLQSDFDKKLARDHYVGAPGNTHMPYRLIEKGALCQGGGGSVWRVPAFAHYIHEQTTLCPDLFISKTSKLGYKNVDNKERYSINCMLFKKNLWDNIDCGDSDDEYQVFEYCKRNNKIIVSNMAVPMVHLMFFTQREENKTQMVHIRNYYQTWLKLPFAISICADKIYENENRLRFLESKISNLEWIISSNSHKPHKGLKKRLKIAFYKVLYKLTWGSTRQFYKSKYKKHKAI